MKVFITGGTSGIGLALAQRYLERGYQVGICGRNIEKIGKIDKNDNLSIYKLDVYDKDYFGKIVNDFSKGKLDIMIAMAGSYANNRNSSYKEKEVTEMLKTNIVGTVNALEIAREIMLKNKKGHIVVMSSVAALLDYDGASIYAKSKRVVMELGKAYGEALSNFGIDVTTIISGYVDTLKLKELNNNDTSHKLFIISEEEAVEKILNAIDNKKKEIIFPIKMKILMVFLSKLPKFLLKRILMWKNKKQDIN